jgi:hypothetical protein
MNAAFMKQKQITPLIFCGIQEGFCGLPDIELWTQPHTGSSLSRQTLEQHNIFVPNPNGYKPGDTFTPEPTPL